MLSAFCHYSIFRAGRTLRSTGQAHRGARERLPATVSRVLNYDSTLSVSDEVRKAVIETTAELNYTTPRQRRKQSKEPAFGRVALIHRLGPEEEMRDPY